MTTTPRCNEDRQDDPPEILLSNRYDAFCDASRIAFT